MFLSPARGEEHETMRPFSGRFVLHLLPVPRLLEGVGRR